MSVRIVVYPVLNVRMYASESYKLNLMIDGNDELVQGRGMQLVHSAQIAELLR